MSRTQVKDIPNMWEPNLGRLWAHPMPLKKKKKKKNLKICPNPPKMLAIS